MLAADQRFREEDSQHLLRRKELQASRPRLDQAPGIAVLDVDVL